MKIQLKVKPLPGWSDHSKWNPDGPPTYLRDLSDEPGPLQISFLEYLSGSIPNPTVNDLIQLASEHASKFESGEVVSTESGDCALGRYGSATIRSSEFELMRIWYLSDGLSFVLATYICPTLPNPPELEEAEKIVLSVSLQQRPWWKLWHIG
jgi:hypothetical protein